MTSGRRCKVLFPYKPVNEDELELQVGDIIDIITEVEEGWWRGSLKNKVGVFPSNFVTELKEGVKPEREAAHRKPKISRDESLKSIGMNSTSSSNNDNLSSYKPDTSPDIPALPPKPAKEFCKAVYKYAASNTDELYLHPGDVITVISKEGPDQDPGWWKGELKGKVGFFPDNFVEVITVEEAQKTELKTKVSNRLGLNISKSATTSSISDTLNSVSRKFSDCSKTTEDKIPPSVSKKPILPPPPTSKKPLSSLPSPKSTETTTHSVGHTSSGKIVSSSTTTIKHANTMVTETSAVSSTTSKWTVVESSDSADGMNWSSQRSYSLKDDKKSSDSMGNSVSGLNISTIESTSDLNLDVVGRSSAKLTHPTATRAKAPKRRPPSQLIIELKNGDDGAEEEEDEVPEEKLMNGDADSHVDKDKPNNAPLPWVEELKLSQAKKSLQSKTRVMIGMSSSSSSERMVSERSSMVSERSSMVSERNAMVSERNSMVSERSSNEKLVAAEKAVSEKSISEKAVSPDNKSSLVTLRQQPIIGQRPQSMVASFKSISNPSSTSDIVTVSAKQWNEMVEKVAWLESNFETLTKAVKDLSGKLEDETQKGLAMQQELEKLTDIVTQV